MCTGVEPALLAAEAATTAEVVGTTALIDAGTGAIALDAGATLGTEAMAGLAEAGTAAAGASEVAGTSALIDAGTGKAALDAGATLGAGAGGASTLSLIKDIVSIGLGAGSLLTGAAAAKAIGQQAPKPAPAALAEPPKQTEVPVNAVATAQKRRAQLASFGNASTLLTGPSGIDSNSLQLGKSTLLGQ